jgi:hypothetical protein
VLSDLWFAATDLAVCIVKYVNFYDGMSYGIEYIIREMVSAAITLAQDAHIMSHPVAVNSLSEIFTLSELLHELGVINSEVSDEIKLKAMKVMELLNG